MNRGKLAQVLSAVCAVALACAAMGANGDKEKSLGDAVRANDAAKVAELLKDGADPEHAPGAGGNALELAVMYGNANVLRAFAAGGVDLKQRMDGLAGWTALEWVLVTESPSVEAVKVLIEASPGLDKVKWKTPPALTRGAMMNEEIMRALLKAGADPKVRYNDWGVLEYLVVYGCPGSMRAIVESGADPHVELVHSRTFWHLLAGRESGEGAIEIARYLKEQGVGGINAPDDGGVTPLQLSAGMGSPGNVRALVAAGADVNLATTGGRTPLIYAVLRGNVATVSALLEAGAKVGTTDEQGVAPLYWALSAADPMARTRWNARETSREKSNAKRGGSVYEQIEAADPMAMVKALLDAGADPNKAEHEWTPLGLAAFMWDNSNARRQERAGGGDEQAERQSPESSRFYKAHDPAAMVKMLVDAGAERVKSDDGMDPLDVAARRLDSRHDTVMAEVRKAKVREGGGAGGAGKGTVPVRMPRF